MKVINGECLEEMDKLIEQGVKVDAIITDPPFLHVKGGMKSKNINVGLMNDKSYMNTKMADFDEKKINLFLDTSKKIMNGTFNGFFFCSKLQIVHYLVWAKTNKLNYDVLIWDREKTGIISTKFFNSNIDYVIRIYGKGRGLRRVEMENGKGDPHYYTKIYKGRKPKITGHETEKAVEQMEKYIKTSTDENDIVLDPFMGSGTTGVACKNLKRDFIGIEMNKEYFDISKTRLEDKMNNKTNNQ